MSETADYDPGPWKGHDFRSARKAYDAYAGRSYDDAVSARKTTADVLLESVESTCERPLIVICDVTGSMGEWPATIFSKLPYLDIEGKQYLGQDMQICFAAVGDATCDKYPLQVRPFSAGLDLKTQLTQLVVEGGGGGQTTESYELAALYFARNFRATNSVARPIIVFIGDEQPYSSIERSMANSNAKVLINQRLSTKDVFAELMENNSVYLVRKPYSDKSDEPEIRRHWVSLLGEDRIAELPDASRIVDVIFGILANEANMVDYFRTEIEERQRPDQVATVYRSLATIHTAASKHTGKSIMVNRGSGKMSRSLLE